MELEELAGKAMPVALDQLVRLVHTHALDARQKITPRKHAYSLPSTLAQLQ